MTAATEDARVVAGALPATPRPGGAPGRAIDARSWDAGTAPADGTAGPTGRAGAREDAAVFVDPAGARSRWLTRAGRLIGGACTLYLLATTLSVLGATWVPHLALPALGPVVPAAHPAHRPSLPASALATPLPGVTAKAVPPGLSVAPQRGGPTVAGHSGGRPSGGATPTAPATTAPVPKPPGKGPPTSGPPPTGPPTSSPPTTGTAPGHSGSTPGRQKHGA